MQNPFLNFDFFYKFSSTKKRSDELLKIVHGFTDSVILKRRKELMKTDESETTTDSNEDDVGVKKKKLAFLDILLKSTIDGKPLSNTDIREEVDTFMSAGHDTTANTLIFCLYNLAKYPEIQKKAFEEVRNVMGDDLNKSAALSDLNKMNYLEIIINETLRLYPPVPMFGRKLDENFELSKT
jgi:cytochrome P450 family 4